MTRQIGERLPLTERNALADEVAPSPRARFAWRPLLVVLILRVALNLPFADRYGWHRDELYYRVAAQHLQGGYVEFPPATALIGALAHLLFGDSLVGLRLFALLAGLATTLVAAQIAREVGGQRRAQIIAAVSVGFSPLLIATNGLFEPVSFDQLTTMFVLWLIVRLLLGRGSWMALGLAIGLGLETKYTMAVVVAFVLLAVGIWRRDVLEVKRLAAATAAALIVWSPNLTWQAMHGWISLRWFAHPAASASDESRPLFIGNLLLLTHIVAVPVAAAGVLYLWRRPSLRPLAILTPAVVLFYFVSGGKSYYALPVVMFALACGAVPFDRWASKRRLIAVGTAFGVLLTLMLPIGLPVLPLRTAVSWHILDARSDFKDEIGWPRFADQVAQHSAGVSVALTRNYGEAGALLKYGNHLPPIASPYVTFRYWLPRVSGQTAIAVGFRPLSLNPFCSHLQEVAKIRMPVDNEERGRAIMRCRLRAPLSVLWPRLVARFGR